MHAYLLLLSLFAPPAQSAPVARAPIVHEKKDDQGRLVSRVTFLPDGTISHLSMAYGPESEKLTLEQDVDQRRVPVRRKREQTDRRGRLVEREEMTLQGTRPVTKRTKFKYDANGRQTAETQTIE